VGPRCRKGHPNGVMPHRRTGSRRFRAAQARSRRPLPLPRCRSGAPAARPQPRPPACSLPGEPYLLRWPPGTDASPAGRRATIESNLCSTHPVDLARAATSSRMPAPQNAVRTGHRRRRGGSLRGVMRR
jgi:hypothetical protein